jgi:hypothetical protein
MAITIQAVLPLKLDDAERGADSERVRAGLIPSLRRFCDPAFIRKLSIVVPDADVERARALAQAFECPAEVLPESMLLPRLPEATTPIRGWYLQQLVKLAYASVCETAFYLTLDADVFLLNRLGPDLFRDGRAPAHYEPVSVHRGWWVQSAGVLEESLAALTVNGGKAFGVTPAFLVTEIARHTVERLSYLAGVRECADWVDYLCRHVNSNGTDTWTEYSLYWTHLIHNVPDFTTLYYERPLYRFAHSTHDIMHGGTARDVFGVLQSSFVTVVDFAQTVRTLLGAGAAPAASAPAAPARFDKTIGATASKTHSQNNEDGILTYMISRLPEVRRYFVEFGVGPPWRTSIEAAGLEANCRLLREQGWDGLFMDANDYPPQYGVEKEFITALNINELMAKYRVPADLDIMSIDVDGQDFWIWMNLQLRPKIVVIEQNPTLERERSIVIPFDTRYRWDGTTWFGASLKALDKLGASKGYVLVYTTSANAIFVRGDLIANPEDFVFDELYAKHEMHVRDWLNRPWVTV